MAIIIMLIHKIK